MAIQNKFIRGYIKQAHMSEQAPANGCKLNKTQFQLLKLQDLDITNHLIMAPSVFFSQHAHQNSWTKLGKQSNSSCKWHEVGIGRAIKQHRNL